MADSLVDVLDPTKHYYEYEGELHWLTCHECGHRLFLSEEDEWAWIQDEWKPQCPNDH